MADVEAPLRARAHYFRIGEFNRAGELASASTRVLLRCGHYSTIERILDETVDTARGPALASAHLGKASITGLRNDWAAAIQHNRKAIEILQPLPDERDRRLLGIAISNMAYAFCRLPDFARAEETCREGLDLANEMSDEWLEGKVAGLLALASLLTGNYEKVTELTSRCLQLHEKHPLAEAGTSPAHALDILGAAHIARAEFTQALSCFEQSLAMRRTLNSKFGLGHSYHNIALAYAGLGNVDQAMHELERSLAIREEIRHIEGLSETHGTMAMVHHAAGHDEEALSLRHAGRGVRGRARWRCRVDGTSAHDARVHPAPTSPPARRAQRAGRCAGSGAASWSRSRTWSHLGLSGTPAWRVGRRCGGLRARPRSGRSRGARLPRVIAALPRAGREPPGRRMSRR